jgi:hypothetical protein
MKKQKKNDEKKMKKMKNELKFGLRQINWKFRT